MRGLSRFSALRRFGILAVASLAAGVALPVLAETVPGTSDPYLAGMPSGSTCCGGDVAPANSPVQVLSVPVTPGATMTFAVTGSVDNAGGVPTLSPDGGGVFGTPSNNGISGATWPINALVGVFLDSSQPDTTAAPAGLDFSSGGIGTSFATLSPALKQAFYIGDGLTGTGSGSVQTFLVPAGATRLFLGTSDGFGWANNTGAFSVTATSTGGGGGSNATPIAVPTLSDAMLALIALTLAAFAWRSMRRR